MPHCFFGPIQTCNYEKPLVTIQLLAECYLPLLHLPSLMLRHLPSLQEGEGPLALISRQFHVKGSKIIQNHGIFMQHLKSINRVFLIFDFHNPNQTPKKPMTRLFWLFRTPPSICLDQLKPKLPPAAGAQPLLPLIADVDLIIPLEKFRHADKSQWWFGSLCTEINIWC